MYENNLKFVYFIIRIYLFFQINYLIFRIKLLYFRLLSEHFLQIQQSLFS